MTKKVPYVTDRNGVYQYERRVPKEVTQNPLAHQTWFGGQQSFRRTLGTKLAAELHFKAAEIQAEFDRRLAGARAQINPPPRQFATISTAKIEVTKEYLQTVRSDAARRVAAPWKRQFIYAQQGGDHAEEFERMKIDFLANCHRIIENIQEPGFRSSDPRYSSPIQDAEDLVRLKNLDAPSGSGALTLLIAAIREGMLLGLSEVDQILKGKIFPDLMPANHNENADKPVAADTLTIRQAVEIYLKSKKLRPKSRSETLATLKLFEEVVGNMQLGDLKKKDFNIFVKSLGEKQVGGRDPNSIVRSISPSTVKKRLSFLRSAISHAIDKELYDGNNPADGVKVEAWIQAQDTAIMRKKRPFTVNEINLIFKHPWFTGCASETNIHSAGEHRLNDSHFWAPIVALMTGCRAAELGGLMLSEVDIVSPHPHFYIVDNKYRPTKNGKPRQVPILDKLFELGFREYFARIKATGADRLFPDWTPPKRTGDFDRDQAAWSNAKIIRAFNRTVIPNALHGLLAPEARREVTFHSFRGAFKSMLGLTEHGIAPNVINIVLGHALPGVDKNYIGSVPIEETYSSIRKCSWKSLILPTPPRQG